jgi:hypothetical protein
VYKTNSKPYYKNFPVFSGRNNEEICYVGTDNVPYNKKDILALCRDNSTLATSLFQQLDGESPKDILLDFVKSKEVKEDTVNLDYEPTAKPLDLSPLLKDKTITTRVQMVAKIFNEMVNEDEHLRNALVNYVQHVFNNRNPAIILNDFGEYEVLRDGRIVDSEDGPNSRAGGNIFPVLGRVVVVDRRGNETVINE